jgi:hypothetical protein
MSFFKFVSIKKETHKVHINNDPCKAFKKYAFGTRKLKKQTKITTHMDL